MWVVVDEAHSLGIVGPEGRGWVAAHGLQSQVDIWLGAFGKAWGSAGGMVATSTDWMTWLQSTARSLMFSTAPFPGMVARNHEILTRMPHLDERRRQLLANSHLAGGSQGSPIVSLPQPSVAAAQALAARLWDHRLWVPVIQYPTVPHGRPRLRLSLSACHDPADIQRVMTLCQEVG
ncbi:pyridoxal phosphate-dependent aminotransferase family protein [bacterium]|nr:pyridoxal phosphate-dependent aminotransferase family protein [bacterium]